MSSSFSIATTTHGRVLVEHAADRTSDRVLVTFHGYAQAAEDGLEAARAIPGVARRWHVVAVQALHRFYTRDDREVVASWMTRQDRDDAIQDNIAYVDRALDTILPSVQAGTARPPAVVFLGFSQGTAMAYRAAAGGRHPVAGVIALAGDIPPELKTANGRVSWPPVLVGVGTRETWYTAEKLAADITFLAAQEIPHEVCRFEGGHEWTAEFRAAAGRWLDRLA